MFDIERMEKLLNEPFYSVPRGLTREERRCWAKALAKQIEQEDLKVLQQEAEQQ